MAARKASRPDSRKKTPRKAGTNPRSRGTGAPAKSSARATISGPTRKRGAPAAADAASAKMAGAEELAAAFPHNAAKPSEFDARCRRRPVRRSKPPHPMVTGSTLTETNASPKVGKGNPQVSFNPGERAARSRARRFGRPGAHDQPGRADRRQPEFAQGGAARTVAARRLHPAREDHALRSRAHSGAHRARARLGRARLLRVLRAADRAHARLDLRRGRQAHAGVRALLDRRRRARLDRHGARRARLRGQVLHRRRQLGSRRQQHPGVLHPGRDEVSRTSSTR